MKNIMHADIVRLCFPDSNEPVLKNINLKVSSGEFIVLTGHSGSGKSVLLKCLAGVIPLFKNARLDGKILFQGEIIPCLPEAAGKIGMVTDNPQNQLFCTTVEEDLGFGPSNMLLTAPEIRRRIAAALDFVGLPGYEKRKPETLSGGEMQRVVLASVLTMEPKIFFLDRAADQLDPKGRKNIYQNLHSLCKKEEKTVIIVEEILEDVFPFADRIWIMEKGTIPQDTGVNEDLTPSLICRKGGQHNINIMRAGQICPEQTIKKTDPPAIEIKDLTLSLEDGGFTLKDISLTIQPGEFVSLVGENGAGKTTLTKTFNGLLRPQEGSVFINGLDARKNSTAQLSKHIGYLFQNPLMHVCCSSVEEEIAFSIKIKKFPREEIKKIVNQALKDFRLEELAPLHPYQLSRSMLQKAALASVLVTKPTILVIDEPTSQMSYEEALETMERIADYNQKGHTVIMITHNIKIALDFSRRIIVMKNGRLVRDVKHEHFSDYFGALGESV